MRAAFAVILFSGLAAGCALSVDHPDSIVPMMVSPSTYAGSSCDALRAAQIAVWRRKEDVRIPLKRAAEDFRILAGTAEYGEQKHEFANLLGRLQAIETVAYSKQCELATVEDLKRAYGLDGKERPSWPSKNPPIS